MRSRSEYRLEQKGYRFSGFFTREKAKAKERAALERTKGNMARVLTKTYPGRVYNTTGYSVYVKPKVKHEKA